MKIEQYYDIRFLTPCADHETNAKNGHYVPVYLGEHYFRFSRTVSLPSLPIRGQIYHLNFDPYGQVTFEDDDTSRMVQESGFFEESERATPYFVISHENFLKEALGNAEIGKLQREIWWKNYALEKMERYVPIFRKQGWDLNSSFIE